MFQLRPRFWKGNKATLGSRMCPYCTKASIKSPGETMFYQGPGDNCTYSNIWPLRGSSFYGSEETHQEFLTSLSFPNQLSTSNHFSNLMIWPDVLHVLYRGILSHFAASALKYMADKQHWTPDGSRAVNLINAYAACDTWSRENNRGGLGIEEFSAESLNIEATRFPECNCKGADVKTICLWLEACLHFIET